MEKYPGERSATVEARLRSSRKQKKNLVFHPKWMPTALGLSSFHRPSVGEKCSVIRRPT